MREPNPNQQALFSKKAVSPGFAKAMELREGLRQPPLQEKQFQTKTLKHYRDRRGA